MASTVIWWDLNSTYAIFDDEIRNYVKSELMENWKQSGIDAKRGKYMENSTNFYLCFKSLEAFHRFFRARWDRSPLITFVVATPLFMWRILKSFPLSDSMVCSIQHVSLVQSYTRSCGFQYIRIIDASIDTVTNNWCTTFLGWTILV